VSRVLAWVLDRIAAWVPMDLNDIDTSDLGDE
jgi:hypothetical protein